MDRIVFLFVFLFCLTLNLKAQFPDTASASLSFGSNFDFLDGIKPSELYADFRFDATKKSSSRWGFEAGITHQRTIAYQDTAIIGTYYDVITTTPAPPFDFDFVVISTTQSKKLQVENLALNCTPKFLLNADPNGDKKSRLYVIGNFEVLRSKNEFNSNITSIKRDTYPDRPDIFPIPYDLTPVPSSGVSKYTSYLFYGGIGIEYLYRDQNVDFKFRMNPGYRYTTNRQVGLDSQGLSSTAYFYVAQMEVLEKRIAGIKLGAEVRGNFGDQSFPWISIYLAKRFSLNKLAELFKPS